MSTTAGPNLVQALGSGITIRPLVSCNSSVHGHDFGFHSNKNVKKLKKNRVFPLLLLVEETY